MNEFAYKKVSYLIAQKITQTYSTSFSMATALLSKKQRKGIYAIYGFVRLADEIVDTFHDFDKKYLLDKFTHDTFEAIKYKVSINPVLYAFQNTVHHYQISEKYIDAFLQSMYSDLEKKIYITTEELNQYIYGSAEVVGFMCLKVFCNGNQQLFEQLENSAKHLGSAFQKINFLRDLNTDTFILGRYYFPEMVNHNFNENIKNIIVANIENDFAIAYPSIALLPGKSKLAVLVAYRYYFCLLKKIKKYKPNQILSKRIRISNFKKLILLFLCYIQFILKIY